MNLLQKNVSSVVKVITYFTFTNTTYLKRYLDLNVLSD